MEPETEQDQMTLADVKIFPRIGVTEEERGAPQECRADLVLYGSFKAAAVTDDIERSMDYCRILACMEEAATEREYRLVESLAYTIARKVLANFPASRARVRLRKRPALLAGHLAFVEVEVLERQAGHGRTE